MNWVQIALADEIEAGQMKGFMVGHKRIALYHVQNDGFYATSDNCTHSGQLLSTGTLNGDIVTCPAHEGKFNVKTGKAKAFPCIFPVKKYPVENRDGVIWVNLG